MEILHFVIFFGRSAKSFSLGTLLTKWKGNKKNGAALTNCPTQITRQRSPNLYWQGNTVHLSILNYLAATVENERKLHKKALKHLTAYQGEIEPLMYEYNVIWNLDIANIHTFVNICQVFIGYFLFKTKLRTKNLKIYKMEAFAIIISLSCIILVFIGVYKMSRTSEYKTPFDNIQEELASKGFDIKYLFYTTGGFIGIDPSKEIIIVIKESFRKDIKFSDVYDCILPMQAGLVSLKISIKDIETPSITIDFFNRKIDDNKYLEELMSKAEHCRDIIMAIAKINNP